MYPAPFAVFLNHDDYAYVEPDLSDPEQQNVHVYLFGDNETLEQYSFDDLIPVGIYQDLQIRIADYIS